MKRFICLLLILCLVPVCVFAETLDFTVLLYNTMAEGFGCKQLPEEYKAQTTDEGIEERHYAVDEKTIVVMYSDHDNVFRFMVYCLSDEPTAEFYKACQIAACVLMNGYDSEAQLTIENKYLRLMCGLDNEISIVNRYGITIQKKSFGIVFFIQNIDMMKEQ